jgi:molybdopterin converting factor subunit 1
MRILFFGQTKDVAGAPEMEIKIPSPVGADEVWDKIGAAHPQLAPFRKTTRLARNGEYAGRDTRFADADEVALIPPVSGG